MTTTIKVHVNGKYRAKVEQDGREPVIVEGNYNGGSGERAFYLPHPAEGTFRISEEQVMEGDERPIDTPVYVQKASLTFSQALERVKAGDKIARAGWNGKDMFLFLVPGSTFTVNRAPLLGIYPEGATVQYHAHIDMKTAQGYVVPWLASQADLLANDWLIVE